MALPPPNLESLGRIVESLELNLGHDELAAVAAIVGGLAEGLQNLDQAQDPAPTTRWTERRVGERPSREQDPYNAIVRRCSIQGAKSGRLAGKRVAVKDTVSVAGVPLTCGPKLLVASGFVPDRDAEIVRRMLDEGAEIVATLNMDDLALAPTGATSAYGPVRNPHDPERLAGGSSGGSAAALFYDDIDLTIGGEDVLYPPLGVIHAVQNSRRQHLAHRGD